MYGRKVGVQRANESIARGRSMRCCTRRRQRCACTMIVIATATAAHCSAAHSLARPRDHRIDGVRARSYWHRLIVCGGGMPAHQAHVIGDVHVQSELVTTLVHRLFDVASRQCYAYGYDSCLLNFYHIATRRLPLLMHA